MQYLKPWRFSVSSTVIVPALLRTDGKLHAFTITRFSTWELQCTYRALGFFYAIKPCCALAEPGGPWRLTFALGRLENLTFFIQIIYAGHPRFYLFRILCFPQFSLEHSLVMYVTCHLIICFFVEPTNHFSLGIGTPLPWGSILPASSLPHCRHDEEGIKY